MTTWHGRLGWCRISIESIESYRLGASIAGERAAWHNIGCARYGAIVELQVGPALANAAPLVALAITLALPGAQEAAKPSSPSVVAMRASAASLANAPVPAVSAARLSHRPRALGS